MKSKRIYKDEFHTITESDGELPFTVKRSIKAAMSDGTPYKNASLPRRVATLKDAVALIETFTLGYELAPHIFANNPLVKVEEKPRTPTAKPKPKPVGRPKKRQKPGPKPKPKRKERSDKAPWKTPFSLGRFYCFAANGYAQAYRCILTEQQFLQARTAQKGRNKNIVPWKLMPDFQPNDCLVITGEKDCLTTGRGKKAVPAKFQMWEAEQVIEEMYEKHGKGFEHPKRHGGRVSSGIGYEVHFMPGGEANNALQPFVILITRNNTWFSGMKGPRRYAHLHSAIESAEKHSAQWQDPFTSLATAVANDKDTDGHITIRSDTMMDIKGMKQ